MPRQRPAASGYARLAQADEEEQALNNYDSEDEDLFKSTSLPATATRYVPIQPQARDTMRAPGHQTPTKRTHPRRRMRSNSSGIDIKAINARLERWADEIASKFKISSGRGKTQEDEKLEIHHSVFQPPEGVRPATAETLALETQSESSGRLTKAQFEEIVESVRVAIEMGIHPKMISQGSSGSYFARNA